MALNTINLTLPSPKSGDRFHIITLFFFTPLGGSLNRIDVVVDADITHVIGRIQTGQSQTEVARQSNVHQITISRLWQRLNQTGSAQDRPRSGRPRITISGCSIYLIEQSVLQPLLLIFGQKDLMLDHF